MKRLLQKALLITGLLAVLWPGAGRSDEMSLDKRVLPGITFIQYEGQVFRFATPVTLNVNFETLSASLIHLTFVAPPGGPGQHVTANTVKVAVYWVTFDTNIYEGAAPVGEPWDGILNTEGGFVDR